MVDQVKSPKSKKRVKDLEPETHTWHRRRNRVIKIAQVND